MDSKQIEERVHITTGDDYPKEGTTSPATLSLRNKRIVTKGQYVRLRGKRESIRLLGVCLLLTAGMFGFLTVCILSILGMNLGGCVLGLCLGIVTCLIGKWGLESLYAAGKIDPGVPLTRANTADLPAPDSLVRASQEPPQEPQAVLLRAAAEGAQTPAEQLVRAASEQE